jgi:branched-chain amino acid transport system substrate-binding protein
MGAKTYKLGVVTPLTGDAATYGTATKRGVDLAIDEINSAGGINGTKVQAVYEDDKADPKEAVNAFNKLVQSEKAPVVLGAFVSRATLAIAPVAEERKVVLFSASSTADEIKNAGDYIFRNVPPNQGQGKTAAEFILQKLGKKTTAVLYQNDDYGKSLASAFVSEYQTGGGKVVLQESFERGQNDMRQAIAKIKAAKPDVVFFPGNYEGCGLILKQAREVGPTAVFVGGDGAYSPELFKIAGPTADGSYYTLMAMGYGVSDDLIQKFTAAFKAKYGEDPDVYAAYAYDAVGMIAQAIKAGGYTADGIKKSLYATEYKGVTGITKMDKYGEVDKPYYLQEARGGKFQMVNWVPAVQSQEPK